MLAHLLSKSVGKVHVLYINHMHESCYVLTDISLTISDILTLSLTHFIKWKDCEEILVTGTGIVRSEGVVGISDIVDVFCIVCHNIIDGDSVPDTKSITRHIQREGSIP